MDKDGYGYEYDYENRITRITKNQGQTTLAEFHYDALGRKIAKDVAGGAVTLYYYNPNWQLLSEYDLDSGQHQRSYVYGNYIDEVLMMREADGDDYYYLHDHLYSPAALVDENGDVVERYEYDVYGKPGIMDGSYNNRTASSYANPYMFTGRTVDYLDSGSLKLQYNRNRYYDYSTGRWLTQDPLGIVPNAIKPNVFLPRAQYRGGADTYSYVGSNPMRHSDSHGLFYDPTLPLIHFMFRGWDLDIDDPNAEILQEARKLKDVRNAVDDLKTMARSALLGQGAKMKCPSDSMSWHYNRYAEAQIVPISNGGLRLSLQQYTLKSRIECEFSKVCCSPNKACAKLSGKCTAYLNVYDRYDFHNSLFFLNYFGEDYDINIRWTEPISLQETIRCGHR